jgi:hypothetical protein
MAWMASSVRRDQRLDVRRLDNLLARLPAVTHYATA